MKQKQHKAKATLLIIQSRLSCPLEYYSAVDRQKQKESNRRPNLNLQIKCSPRTDWARNESDSPRCKTLCIQIAAILEQQRNHTYRAYMDLHQRASVTPPPFSSSGARISATWPSRGSGNTPRCSAFWRRPTAPSLIHRRQPISCTT